MKVIESGLKLMKMVKVNEMDENCLSEFKIKDSSTFNIRTT